MLQSLWNFSIQILFDFFHRWKFSLLKLSPLMFHRPLLLVFFIKRLCTKLLHIFNYSHFLTITNISYMNKNKPGIFLGEIHVKYFKSKFANCLIPHVFIIYAFPEICWHIHSRILLSFGKFSKYLADVFFNHLLQFTIPTNTCTKRVDSNLQMKLPKI